jgi:hypothetical protein
MTVRFSDMRMRTQVVRSIPYLGCGALNGLRSPLLPNQSSSAPDHYPGKENLK